MKNLKPIDQDIHFKYRCPNKKCRCYHWASLNELQIDDFCIVCDCKTVLRPRKILAFKIKYTKSNNNLIDIDYQLKAKTVLILIDNGFLGSEADSLTEKAYLQSKIKDPIALAKYILKNIGGLDKS